MPALSGPRSDICVSIAPRCSPRCSSSSDDLLNRPTIPHMFPNLHSTVGDRWVGTGVLAKTAGPFSPPSGGGGLCPPEPRRATPRHSDGRGAHGGNRLFPPWLKAGEV